MSLRVRLVIAVGTVALLGLVAADVSIYRALKSYLYDRVDQDLDALHDTMAAALPTLGRPFDQTFIAAAPGAYVELRDATGAFVGADAAARSGREDAPTVPNPVPGLDPTAPGTSRVYLSADAVDPDGPRFRVRAEVLADGRQLIVAIPLDHTTSTLHRLLAVELLVTAGALVAAVALGWWLVGLGLAPLARMEQAADAIVGGEALDRRVPGEDEPTEVGSLARSLNTMLARLQGAFRERDATEAELRRSEQRLRRFVADASHELRTPLAAVSAYAELYERGGDAHVEDRPRLVAGIRHETARMGRLVEDLLLLARLDEGQPLERRPVELVGLAAEAVAAAEAVGPAWPTRIDADRPVEVLGDAARLRQVLDNLLANARSHTPEGTPVTVRVASTNGHGVLEVTDRGPGLRSEDAARVFERFYRTDESRSRRSGGTGLGLAIVAAIVDAHGGEVRLDTHPGHGARFTVSLPLAEDRR
jgi:two-component system OmpR family sensor kinase